MKTARVGENTKLYELGYRHAITFTALERNKWQKATETLTACFGEPARRRHFRTPWGSSPRVAAVFEKHKHNILNALWYSDTRHWEQSTHGYWIAFRDQERFCLALLTVEEIK